MNNQTIVISQLIGCAPAVVLVDFGYLAPEPMGSRLQSAPTTRTTLPPRQ